MVPRIIGKRKTSMLSSRLFVGFMLISFLWGCAGKKDTVLIKDTSETVKPGTIISAKTGNPVTFEQLMDDLNHHQIVFIGEVHTNPAHHSVQLKIIEAVYKNNPSVRIGMEMFDRSYQQVLDLWTGMPTGVLILHSTAISFSS